MTKTFAGCCSALLIFGLQAIPVSLGTAQAASPGHEEVTVSGPYVVREQLTKRAISGELAEKKVSVSQDVNFSDLNLSRPGDLEALRSRVKIAAVANCRELNRRFPTSTYILFDDSRKCARDAASEAMAKVDAIVVARAGQPQTVARADIPTTPAE